MKKKDIKKSNNCQQSPDSPANCFRIINFANRDILTEFRFTGNIVKLD